MILGNASPDAGSLLGTLEDPAARVALAACLTAAAESLQSVADILQIGLPSLGEHEPLSRHDDRHVGDQRLRMKPITKPGPPPNHGPEFLSLSEVENLLGMGSRALRRLRRDSTLKFPRPREFGRTLRWKRSEIESWTETRRTTR